MNPTRRALTAVFASTFLQLVAGFMLLPWLLYRLDENGVAVTTAGALAAASWVGILAITPFVGRLVNRIGRQKTLLLACIMSTASVAGLLLTSALLWWFLLVLLESLSAGLRWVVGEAMVVDLAPNGQCGKGVGLYETMVGSTFFIGPMLLNWCGTSNPNVPWYALLMVGSALIMSLWTGSPSQARDSSQNAVEVVGLPQAFRRHSALAVIAFVGGFFEGGVSTALPIYGLSLGFNAEVSTWLVAASGVASAVVMLPAGLLVDRMSRHHLHQSAANAHHARRRMMLGCTIFTIGLTLLMPWLGAQPPVALLVAFAWGGAGGCLYTLAVIDMGERESGTALFEATAVLVLAYTLGAIAGPLAGAAAMQAWERIGFPLLLVAVSILGWWPLRQSTHRPIDVKM
ncbi:MAG TPA: MFS transporter [Hydrogenophaga sp.]